ncbi:amidohydrolase family protein [Pseudonocardia spinosispora]|uniref:amidohydrolase family protein n=1 Tax=Pseudonocardia spinosispora TaxID=103441 RepID=UPI00041616BB|nr:amidohydrolase family protein [Pseudonocardia spinosispora]
MTAILIAATAAWRGDSRLERNSRVLITERNLVWDPEPSTVPGEVVRYGVDGVLVPGLVDHHVHIEQIDLAELGASGLSEVVDLGGRPDEVFALRDRSRDDPDLPLVHAVGPFLTAPGGYLSDRKWAPAGTWTAIETEDDVLRAVARSAARKAVAIKVVLHEDDPVALPISLLRTLVNAAAGVGLPVVAHVEGRGQADRAIAAGIRRLAHTPWTHRLSHEVIALSAATMTWTSTLDVHSRGEATPEYATALDNLRRFHAAGGRVQYGTDLGNGPLPVGVNARELHALTEAGLTSVHILRAICLSRTAVAVLPADPLMNPYLLSDIAATARVGRAVRLRSLSQ